MDKITGISIKAGSRKLEVIKMNHVLEEFQNIVGGYIEVTQLREDILIILNEEGKLIGLEPNMIMKQGSDIKDIVVGDIFICSSDYEGNFKSLNKEQISWIRQNVFSVETNKGVVLMVEVE